MGRGTTFKGPVFSGGGFVGGGISGAPAGKTFYVNTNTSGARNSDRPWYDVDGTTVFLTHQAAIDACVDDRGDIIYVARSYAAVSTPVLFNKAGITMVGQDYGMPGLEKGEYFTIDNTTGGAPAATISKPCAIYGLGFHTAWTGGTSSNILCDWASGWPGWLHMAHCRIMNWGTATVYGINFEAGANCVVEKNTFEGTAGQKFTAGIAFGGSPTNNPIQDTVEDNRFRDCTYAIEHKDGTPQNFLYHNNKVIDGKLLNSKSAAADGLVSGNWLETATDTGSYDVSVATMQGNGLNFSGNNYSE